ncbi:MAG: bifunctional phosphopantothenoylcysteine decarboxylase/phosphopantothenate--cysteine ligase CoaBC [Coriobacteriia bacterium]
MVGAQKTEKTVVLGVTGGIGAYKSCDLVRRFVKAGLEVKVVMTEAATRFVAPLTFRTLSGNPVATSLWEAAQAPVHHVSLAREADVMLIAPCTANVIAKLAHGRADDILTTTALATTAPLVIAPAMNEAMWLDEATRENVEVLRRRGVVIVGPGEGDLACGDEGVGRLAPLEDIHEAVMSEIGRVNDLEGLRVLVTAGGTQEPIDAVRFIGNRSSGKMGFSIAQEAARRGAQVTVIAAATSAPEPAGCRIERARTAQEMRARVMEVAPDCDVIVMAAAVADFRPADPSEGKLSKKDGVPNIHLEPTPDILSDLGASGSGALLVGFAAEAGDPVPSAKAKLEAKGLDLVVANDIASPGVGFESDFNEVTLVTREDARPLPRLAKREVARILWDTLSKMVNDR